MTSIALTDPRRVDTGMQPIKAFRHFQNLIADKEDTEQVFHIINALKSRKFEQQAQAFFATPVGQQQLATNAYLPALLDDHAALQRLPASTVGRVYVEFMQREGLTAQGLVDEYAKFSRHEPAYDDLVQRFADRLRDTHDLFHILTGYGRDALGEECVLAFSYSQNPNLGIFFIAYAAARETKKTAGANIPIYAAVREAQKMGARALPIAHQDIAALLAEPIDSARARLGIGKPTRYLAAHDAMRAAGIDPYAMLAQKPQAALAA